MDLDPENLTQAQLAEVVGVDRGTVRAWTKQGMPYTAPDARGKPASYCGPLAINWWGGHQAAAKWGIKLSPLEKIALGLTLGTDSGPTADERAMLLETAGRAGFDREDTLAALATARGLILGRKAAH